jgi:hypothetical protein
MASALQVIPVRCAVCHRLFRNPSGADLPLHERQDMLTRECLSRIGRPVEPLPGRCESNPMLSSIETERPE